MAKRYIPISDLGEIVTGKTPPTANGELWGGSIPFITPTDIKGFSSFYQGETERTVSDIGASKQKKTLLFYHFKKSTDGEKKKNGKIIRRQNNRKSKQ